MAARNDIIIFKTRNTNTPLSMKQEHINEIKSIIIFAVGVILLCSLLSFVSDDLPWIISYPNIPARNWIGITGAYLAGAMFFTFGFSSYAIVFFLFFWSWIKFSLRQIKFSTAKLLSSLVFLGVLSSLLAMIGLQDPTERFERGGITGLLISDFLVRYIGSTGAYITLFVFGTLSDDDLP